MGFGGRCIASLMPHFQRSLMPNRLPCNRIRGYEVGPDQQASMSTICNLLQEVASNHAVSMWGRTQAGFATDPALADQGLIFVMTRLQIQMDSYPRW